MIKAILFDMDGTLVDSERYYTEISYKWLCQYVHIDKKNIYKIIGLNMDETYKMMSLLSGKELDETIKSYDLFLKSHPINYHEYLFNDVKTVLKKLKKYKLAICTSSSKEMLDKFLRDCNINEFDLLISNDDVTKPKPDPQIYLKAIDSFKINKKEAIVVEDSKAGIEAGKNAGLYTMARDATRFFVDQRKADYIFEDLNEIFKILDIKNELI